jgi:predicted CXXCH cytochrome family protein
MIGEPPEANPQCVEDGCVKTYIFNPGDPVEDQITVPIVVYTGASAPTEYLSGGNFWWVKGPASGSGDPSDPTDWTGGQDDTKGHNIFSGEPDDYLTSAPGGAGCNYGTFCHANLHTLDTSGAAGPGRQGCLKCHMVLTYGGWPPGFHHADDTSTVVGTGGLDGVQLPGDNGDTQGDNVFDGWYRFLSGHMAGDAQGVCGIEDADWQATKGSDDHNEYLGSQASLDSAGSLSALGHTMTGYCSGCHGNFHWQEEAGAFVRHPAGRVIPNTGEFSSFTTYDPDAPVARPASSPTRVDFEDWTGEQISVVPGEDLVNCLSCHRAHGSPYPKMLRWDPTYVDACVICHTTKVTETQGRYHVSEVTDCCDCHNMHGQGPPDYYPPYNTTTLIADTITTPNSDPKNVVFPSGGASDFISDGSPVDGVCEVCHTQTKYYRNDGTSPGGEHPLYTGDEPVYLGWDCTSCHSHSNEFRRAANQIHATHFTPIPGPDFPLNEDGCNKCHADGRAQCGADGPYFKSGTDENGDARYNFKETDVCGSESCHIVTPVT